MFTKIVCPKCGVEGSISLLNPDYQGPYKCWKCRELYTIELENYQLKSCEPLSQEEFDRQKQMDELKAKFKRE